MIFGCFFFFLILNGAGFLWFYGKFLWFLNQIYQKTLIRSTHSFTVSGTKFRLVGTLNRPFFGKAISNFTRQIITTKNQQIRDFVHFEFYYLLFYINVDFWVTMATIKKHDHTTPLKIVFRIQFIVADPNIIPIYVLHSQLHTVTHLCNVCTPFFFFF